MSVPSICAVLPLFNHERYIADALQSVLVQTSPLDEIIVIDDGSTDSGFSVAKNMLEGDSRTILFRQENAGADAALNRGIGMSRCEYIAVLNTDDLFLPEKISRCREILTTRSGTECICGGLEMIGEHGETLTDGDAMKWLNQAIMFQNKCRNTAQGLLHDNYVTTTSNMVFSKKLWLQCNGFQKLRYCHDIDFLLTALAGHPVVIDSHYLHIRYRIHSSNTISENNRKLLLEIAAVMANALLENGRSFADFDNYPIDLLVLSEILKAKNNALLLCTLMAERAKFDDRTGFYEKLQQQPYAEELMRLFVA